MKARPQTQAGMARPARKKSVLVFIEPFKATPMPSTKAKYTPRISQSIPVILNGSFHSLALRFRWRRVARKKMGDCELRSVHESRDCRKHLCRFAQAGGQIFGLTSTLARSYVRSCRKNPVLPRCKHTATFSFRTRICHTN